MTCPCAYPIIIMYNDIPFFALPFEELEHDGTIDVPLIYEEINERGKWVVVKWRDDIHRIDLKEYIVNDHIVIAGCEEAQLSCDNKSIFKVFHPKKEWNKKHMINV